MLGCVACTLTSLSSTRSHVSACASPSAAVFGMRLTRKWSLIFVGLRKADAGLLRKADKAHAEEERRYEKEESCSIGVFHAEELGGEDDGQKGRGTDAADE